MYSLGIVNMRFFTPAALAPLLAVTAASSVPATTINTDILAAQGLLHLASYEIKQAFAGVKQNCTIANAYIRKEW